MSSSVRPAVWPPKFPISIETPSARRRGYRRSHRSCRALVYLSPYADVAQLVEHNLAKVGVAGSNPVVRSKMGDALSSGLTARGRSKCSADVLIKVRD